MITCDNCRSEPCRCEEHKRAVPYGPMYAAIASALCRLFMSDNVSVSFAPSGRPRLCFYRWRSRELAEVIECDHAQTLFRIGAGIQRRLIPKEAK